MSCAISGGRALTHGHDHACNLLCPRLHNTAGFSGRQLNAAPQITVRYTYRRPHYAARAALSQPDETYQGVYGPWKVEESDRQEVLGYRAGLSLAAAAVLIDTAISWVSEDNSVKQVLRPVSNAVAVAGAGGFGASLVLIHIYVKPMKRLLQALYAVGLAGGLYLMATQAQSLPEYVAAHREAVWAVGPLFAAATGVAFKEGVCYGKPECALLFLTTPALLLSHLGGFAPPPVEQALLVAFNVLAGVFAARKYTQPIKDDIGDKSIFEFLALSEDEQEARVAQIKGAGSSDL
ncbi:hypothetical protein WJX73_001370 [Symbiochloris irregularis]|uniref:Uncharacterized protein n=1 Tax=Symbiochloris irregularis TaxID=706552 RepID=A0AAW1PX87_9CHLO